ncbi:MAG: 4-hydroxy-tetrahydrodipicolinate reductase [Eubacteriaceae bacterium]|jgi:4-hydroxy-tetrahydrodipicolinate reductase|nr:4-hydroxy-tetrahydrodipicolinate reductase [Eubacteriaceae bacterium]
MKIFLSGVSGAMGRVIAEMVAEKGQDSIVAGFDKAQPQRDFTVYQSLENVTEDFDVIIDFSHFSVFDSILKLALEKKKPLVMATTGLSDQQNKALAEAAKQIPVFQSANMSLGINLMANALKVVAPLLVENGFDIEIIEKHHRKKVDAPSGTAFLLRDALNDVLSSKKDSIFGRHGKEEKRRDEIGIHAVRGGTIPGEHLVLFAGEDELFEIKHNALSKKVFAQGALSAAAYLTAQQPGLYDMDHLIAGN